MADINSTVLITTQTPNLLELLMAGPWIVIPEFVPILVSMTTVIVTLGLVSNILLIVSIWKAPKLHTVANSFVIFMCLIDVCRILHIIAFDFLSGVSGRWQYNKAGACTYSAFMVTFVGKATGLSFCMISCNRVIMITFQKRYFKLFNTRNTIMMQIFVVLVSIALSLPVAIEGINIYVLYSDQTGCCFAYDNNANKLFQISGIFVAVILPSVVMVPSYTWIYIFVRRSKRRVAAHVNVRARPEVQLREELRSAIIIFLTYITYCLFYVPLYTSYVSFLLGVDVSNEVLVISSYLTDFHRFIRPCLYPCLGMAYREALIKIFVKNSSMVNGSNGTAQTLTTERVDMNSMQTNC